VYRGTVQYSRGFNYCVGPCFLFLTYGICSPLLSILIIRYVAAAKFNIILTLPEAGVRGLRGVLTSLAPSGTGLPLQGKTRPHRVTLSLRFGLAADVTHTAAAARE